MNIITAIQTLKNDNSSNRIDGNDEIIGNFIAYKVGKIIRIDIK